MHTATIHDRTIDALRAAIEAHDTEAFIALLADDVIVRSPITTKIRFEGIEQATDLFRRVFPELRDVQLYKVVGAGGSSQVIFWRGMVGSKVLEESNLLEIDDEGRITEMTVFMRALPGLLTFAGRIAPSLARRRGRIRAMVLKVMLGTVAGMYNSGESLALRLAGAGVRTPD